MEASKKKYAKLCLNCTKILCVIHILSIRPYNKLLTIKTTTKTEKKTKNSVEKCKKKLSKQFKSLALL